MELLELSKEKLRKENKKLFEIVKKDYEYDLVVFVARGSYLIGLDMAKYNNVGLLEIFAKRKGGRFKKIVSPFLKLIPTSVKSVLRKKEFNSNYHEKNKDRSVYYDKEIWLKYKGCKRILLVDDSVDTGYSIKYAKEAIMSFFEDAEVKVAAINYFTKSKNVVDTNYNIYVDKMLLGPWSNDSKENKQYIEEYNKWHESQVK